MSPTPWSIALPPSGNPDGTAPPPNQELRALMDNATNRLVEDRTYTAQEMAAIRDLDAVRSWAPPPLHGPRTTLAYVGGRVVGGAELFQRQNPPAWFLDNLVRDPSPEFKGVGREVVQAAIGWWLALNRFGRLEQPLRVHAMVRETHAREWWTWFFNRPPDFSGAFVQSRGLRFDAAGWITYPV